MKVKDVVVTTKGTGRIISIGEDSYEKGYGRLIVVALPDADGEVMEEVILFEKDATLVRDLVGNLSGEKKKIGEFPTIQRMMNIAVGIVIGVIIIVSVIYAVIMDKM